MLTVSLVLSLQDGLIPLMVACCEGDRDLVSVLVENGAHLVNVTNEMVHTTAAKGLSRTHQPSTHTHTHTHTLHPLIHPSPFPFPTFEDWLLSIVLCRREWPRCCGGAAVGLGRLVTSPIRGKAPLLHVPL